MKTYSRKTKGLQTDNWKVNRQDFILQTSEAFTAMNMQAKSKKMAMMPVQHMMKANPAPQMMMM